MNTTLFTSEYCKGFGIDQAIPKVIKFISDYKYLELGPDDFKNIISLKPIVESPINVIFKKSKDEGVLENILSGYFIPKNVTNIPELFLATEFVLDMTEIPSSLKGIVPFHQKNKVIINFTPYLKFDKGIINVMDVNGVHGQVIKSLLVRSFNKADDIWLSTVLSGFLVKLYSISLSSILAVYYHLSVQEQMQVALPLAYFYSKKLSQDDTLFKRSFFLGNNDVLNESIRKIEEISGTKNLSITDLSNCIGYFGPDRMKEFNAPTFYRLLTNIGTDPISTSISLEYPPYLVYQLLAAISNQKTRLSHILKNSKLLEEAKRFTHDLSVAQSFIPELL